MIVYEYEETENYSIQPKGEGWEYWGDRITPEEHVAVWRRDKEQYSDTLEPPQQGGSSQPDC